MKATIFDGSPAGDPTGERIAGLLTPLLSAQGYEVKHIVVLRDKTLGHCRGCFQCWLKTPGICVIDDDNRELSAKFIQSDLVIMLTPVTFGAYSPELKGMLDHLIANVSPFFTTVNGESHHRKRYSRYTDLMAIGWNDTPDETQKAMFRHLAWRNAINFHSERSNWGVVRSEASDAALKAQLEALTRNLDRTTAKSGEALPRIAVTGGVASELRNALQLVGSPRMATSSSAALGGYLLRQLEAQGVATETICIHKAMRDAEKRQAMLDAIDRADLCILAFPLYIDSLPAPVLSLMRTIRERRAGLPPKGAFAAIANCGFIESRQNAHALATCAIFAEAAGLRWLGGIAIGGGEGLVHGQEFLKPGRMTMPYKHALDQVAEALTKGNAVPEEAAQQLAKPFVPAWLHRFAGSKRWKKEARRNGVERELGAQPYRIQEMRAG